MPTKSCNEHGKKNVTDRELFSELFENPIHPLQIHMVPPFVDENSPTFHLQIHGEETGLSRTMNHINICCIFLCPLFSWSELKYLRSIAKTELTYPPFWLNLLLGVNIRANIFRMEKQNITFSDECSGFRAQFYSPRSEFIYDIMEISHALK